VSPSTVPAYAIVTGFPSAVTFTLNENVLPLT
jgi:hypothetical protein